MGCIEFEHKAFFSRFIPFINIPSAFHFRKQQAFSSLPGKPPPLIANTEPTTEFADTPTASPRRAMHVCGSQTTEEEEERVTGRLWAAMNEAGMPFLQFQGRGLPERGSRKAPARTSAKGCATCWPRDPRGAPRTGARAGQPNGWELPDPGLFPRPVGRLPLPPRGGGGWFPRDNPLVGDPQNIFDDFSLLEKCLIFSL